MDSKDTLEDQLLQILQTALEKETVSPAMHEFILGMATDLFHVLPPQELDQWADIIRLRIGV